MVEISTGGATWSLTGQYCPFILREQVSPGCPARWIINLAALVPTAEAVGFACGVVVHQCGTMKQEGGRHNIIGKSASGRGASPGPILYLVGIPTDGLHIQCH